jgi:hypothetical protein
MNNRLSQLLFALPFFLPITWRLLPGGPVQPIGLLSDLALGLLAVLLARLCPFWLRAPLILFWTLFQIAAHELYAAMHRLPCWQDIHYFLDPALIKNSTAGFHLASLWLFALMLLAATIAGWLPMQRPTFHLTGEAKQSAIQIKEFNVTVL